MWERDVGAVDKIWYYRFEKAVYVYTPSHHMYMLAFSLGCWVTVYEYLFNLLDTFRVRRCPQGVGLFEIWRTEGVASVQKRRPPPLVGTWIEHSDVWGGDGLYRHG